MINLLQRSLWNPTLSIKHITTTKMKTSGRERTRSSSGQSLDIVCILLKRALDFDRLIQLY